MGYLERGIERIEQMYNTISLARILNGKHPYKDGATKEEYLQELEKEKMEKTVRKLKTTWSITKESFQENIQEEGFQKAFAEALLSKPRVKEVFERMAQDYIDYLANLTWFDKLCIRFEQSFYNFKSKYDDMEYEDRPFWFKYCMFLDELYYRNFPKKKIIIRIKK